MPTCALAREACTRLSDTYNGVDPLHVLLPDWGRYRCWRALQLVEHWLAGGGGGGGDETALVAAAKRKLRDAAESLPYTANKSMLTAVLESTVGELRRAASAQGDAILLAAVAVVDGAVRDVTSLRDPTMSYF